MRLPNAFPHKRDRLVSLFFIMPLLLSFGSPTSTVSGCIIYSVFSSTAESKFVYEDIQISVLTIFVGSHNIGPHLGYFVESGRHEPPKHVGFAHRQQCIIISARALDKFLNLQVIGSFDDREVQYFF